MNRFIMLIIVLLVGIAVAGWMAYHEEARLHEITAGELNELRSTIAAGGTVEL